MANSSKNIIVGAGVVYVGKTTGTEYVETDIHTNYAANTAGSYQDPTVVDSTKFRHVGYTSEGVTFDFSPDYGEVNVDQLLDVAKIYKQGQKAMIKTTFAEATLENLFAVVGSQDTDYNSAASQVATSKGTLQKFEINGGALGLTPLERSILVVGPGPEVVTANANGGKSSERIYLGYRAVSMEAASVAIKRNEATVFPVTFRLLASNTQKNNQGNAATSGSGANALYGKIIDRVYVG